MKSEPGRLDRWLARLLGVRPGRWTTALVASGVIVILAAMAVSAGDVATYPGQDLRAKVIGARAMLLGLDPYHYQAGPDTPEELQDYGRLSAQVTRVTYPPTLLFLYAPLSSLTYRTQRYLWAGLEWAALVAAILLLVRCCRSQRQRIVFFLGASVLFAGGYYWRVHVERGQYYVFLLLLLTFAAWASRKGSRESWLGGLAIGFAVALRPTWVVLIPALWLLRLRKSAAWATVGALVAVALTLPLVGLSGWNDYWSAMSLMGRAWAGDQAVIASLGRPFRPSPVIEGWDYSRNAMLPSLMSNNSIAVVALRAMGPSEEMLQAFARVWPWLSKVLGGLAGGGLVVVAWLLGAARRSARTRLAIALCSGLVLDYFVPIRYAYADVVFLAPLALLLPGMLLRGGPRLPAIFAASGLLLGLTLLAADGGLGRLGPLSQSAGVMAAMLGCALWLSPSRRERRAARPEPAAAPPAPGGGT